MKRVLTVTGNGIEQQAVLSSATVLLQVLLKQTGFKRGCDPGNCETCTLSVENKRLGCHRLEVNGNDLEMETVERGSSNQEKVSKNERIQCRLCSPNVSVNGELFVKGLQDDDSRTGKSLFSNRCSCTEREVIGAVSAFVKDKGKHGNI